MSYLSMFLNKAQSVRMEIQERLGSSGDKISTSDLNRGLRAEADGDSADDDLSKDTRKFFYAGPLDFFKNHKKNMEEFIEKHISKPIDKLSESDSGD